MKHMNNYDAREIFSQWIASKDYPFTFEFTKHTESVDHIEYTIVGFNERLRITVNRACADLWCCFSGLVTDEEIYDMNVWLDIAPMKDSEGFSAVYALHQSTLTQSRSYLSNIIFMKYVAL